MEKPNNEKIIKHIKNLCKQIKKAKVNSNIPLMRIQHKVAVFLGFKKWSDLLENIDENNIFEKLNVIKLLVIDLKQSEKIDNKEKK